MVQGQSGGRAEDWTVPAGVLLRLHGCAAGVPQCSRPLHTGADPAAPGKAGSCLGGVPQGCSVGERGPRVPVNAGPHAHAARVSAVRRGTSFLMCVKASHLWLSANPGCICTNFSAVTLPTQWHFSYQVDGSLQHFLLLCGTCPYPLLVFSCACLWRVLRC